MPTLADLTPRQRQVVSLVTRGLMNKEIAADLGISAHVVKHHLSHIFERVGVGSRAELAVWAAQQVPILAPEPAPMPYLLVLLHPDMPFDLATRMLDDAATFRADVEHTVRHYQPGCDRCRRTLAAFDASKAA